MAHRAAAPFLPRWLAAALVSLAVSAAVATPAKASVASVVGARPFDREQMGLWAAIGAPDVELGARWGVSSVWDAGARLRLSYGTGSQLGGFGSSVHALLRLRIASWAGWDIALAAEPGVFVHAGVQGWTPLVKAGQAGTAALLGVDLGVPSAVASTTLAGNAVLSLGLAAPALIHLGPEPTLVWQVLSRAQVAVPVAPRWSVVGGGEIGTAFYGPGAGSPAADPVWRLSLGVSWQ